MTQSNPLHTEETPELNAKLVRDATWAAALLIAAGLAFFGYAISIVTFTDWEDYILVGFPLVLAGASLASIVIMRRGNLALGSGIIFSLNLVIPLLLAFIIRDTLWTASAYAFVSSALLIWRAIPRRSWRWATLAAAAVLVVVVVVNLINPAGRFAPPEGFGVFVAVLLTILFIAFFAQAVRQAWFQNNIRSRFLTLSLGLTILVALVIAAISVSSLLSAGKQAQETSSTVLREQAQDEIAHLTITVSKENELVLQGISQNAKEVASQAASIFENPGAFNAEENWVADEHMFLGELGQYINGPEDVSTVFIPNTVPVTDSIKKQLELIAFLDSTLVPVYEGDPNSVAIYYIGKEDITWYYPNINLGSFLPPDISPTQDIFFTIATPENNPDREVVWTPVYDDPGGQGLLVSAIAPVYANNSFRGIVGIDVSLAGLTATIEQAELATEGYSILLDADGRALALPEQGYQDFYGREREANEFGSNFVASARPEFAPVISDILSGATDFQSVEAGGQELYISYTTMESTGWHVVSVVAAEQVLAPAVALQTELAELSTSLVFGRILPVGLVFIAIAVVAGIFFTNRLVNPIEQLTEGAAKIGERQWDTPLPHSDLIEISGLSNTLSTMATELKGTLDSLEQRIAARTRNLELAAEVGRAVSQVRALDVMLKDACDLILKEFNLYYVQVYLIDPSQTKLVLEAGTGSVGAQLLAREHNLAISTGSINGRAAVEKRSVIISDTAQSATFRPNVLLPETRGEMAVPLIVGDRVVGVLDMQSSYPGVLNEEVLPAFEALAGQLAVAVQNANLLAETEQARAQVESQARRLVQAGWTEHLDAIHKPEQLGYVFARNEVTPLAEIDETQLPENGKAISVPISLTGEALGSLAIEIDDETRLEQTSELVNIVARQVAQQIENLRLLESAERYRVESERAAYLQTIQGWQQYIESRPKDKLGFMYDSNDVQVLDKEPENTSLTLPIKVGDATVGTFAVQDVENQDDLAVEIAKSIMERLGAHIENLRLLEETKQGQVELDKRAKQLAAVAEISTVSSQEQEVDKMLKTVVNLTQRQFGLYHAHIFVLNEENKSLDIVACGWEEGSPHEGTHETNSIPLDREQSLVARAARTGQSVIINNVKAEAGWLPNPLLPDTESEMAVPLIVGDHVLGVIDVQSNHINAFSNEDANIQTTLASQVATAMQNARSFTQAQKQAERETMLNTINQKIQSATSVEAVLQIAARELGTALGAPMTVAQLSMKDKEKSS